eukprot:TRINITY_DN92835_c0_g1_i1.p1 TRINITY_DN92835_c0_g1~~TRINITY_DN92835_c0_g1_i1.p1  ORF type:complete len:426 (+),score=64.20 TRINITY_DN92835_c0_g1_i1:65-1279(+)
MATTTDLCLPISRTHAPVVAEGGSPLSIIHRCEATVFFSSPCIQSQASQGNLSPVSIIHRREATNYCSSVTMQTPHSQNSGSWSPLSINHHREAATYSSAADTPGTPGSWMSRGTVSYFVSRQAVQLQSTPQQLVLRPQRVILTTPQGAKSLCLVKDCAARLQQVSAELPAGPKLHNQEICAICLGPLQNCDTVQPMARCQHVFHSHCFLPYFIQRQQHNQEVLCPVCRQSTASSLAEVPSQEHSLVVPISQLVSAGQSRGQMTWGRSDSSFTVTSCFDPADFNDDTPSNQRLRRLSSEDLSQRLRRLSSDDFSQRVQQVNSEVLMDLHASNGAGWCSQQAVQQPARPPQAASKLSQTMVAKIVQPVQSGPASGVGAALPRRQWSRWHTMPLPSLSEEMAGSEA